MEQTLLCNLFYPSFFADFLIALIGAILGIGGAYLIYRISIRQVRIDRLRYVVSLIESFVTSAKRQARYCKEHSEAILATPFTNRELKLEANRDIKRLADKMDQEGVYHAYLWKYKRKDKSYEAFKNLYGYIDYLDYLIDDLIKMNERIIEFLWQRKKDYQVSFKKLKEMIQTLSLDEDAKRERPEFVEFATNTLKGFLNKIPEMENITESYTSVVEPMRNFIVEKVKQHPRVTEIYLQLDDLVGLYYGIELQSKHNAADYKFYADALIQKAEQLDESGQQLQRDFTTKR